MEKKNNERNAGRPPKFSKGGKMVTYTFNRNLPEKGVKQIVAEVDKVINQFKDYDFT